MYVRPTHITYYKRTSPRVNVGLTLLLYVCVAHTHEPNPSWWGSSMGSIIKSRFCLHRRPRCHFSHNAKISPLPCEPSALPKLAFLMGRFCEGSLIEPSEFAMDSLRMSPFVKMSIGDGRQHGVWLAHLHFSLNIGTKSWNECSHQLSLGPITSSVRTWPSSPSGPAVYLLMDVFI